MERHFIQLEILNFLQKKVSAKFSDINENEYPSDQFNFHLKKLLQEGFIEKNENNLYSLTNKGLELAGRLNSINSTLIKQPKVIITLGIFRNNDTEVLLLKRNRQPSKNKITWYDRKMRIGSTLDIEIKGLLQDETGLSSENYKFIGVSHVVRKDKEIEFDGIILNFKIQDPSGQLLEFGKDGENKWYKIEDAKKLKDAETIVGFEELLKSFLSEKIYIREYIN